MKTLSISVLLISLLILACATSRKAPYVLPDAMLPEVKVEYAKNCEKGYFLYKLSCAKCHSTKKWGKEIIPDFSSDQLRGYALRVSNTRHESNLPDSLISEEELMYVMTFLSYKKKN
jgi:hypothetical protein